MNAAAAAVLLLMRLLMMVRTVMMCADHTTAAPYDVVSVEFIDCLIDRSRFD